MASLGMGTRERQRPGSGSPRAARPRDAEARGQQISRRGWGGGGRGRRGGTLPTLGSARHPAAPLQSQSFQLPPLPSAFTCSGPCFHPTGPDTLIQAPTRLSRIQPRWGWGAALLSIPLPLCSPCQLLLPEVSPAPSPWKPSPRRWQGPNLHPSAGSAHPAHGPTETRPADVSEPRGPRGR